MLLSSAVYRCESDDALTVVSLAHLSSAAVLMLHVALQRVSFSD
jgi:hypothetical protein